MNTPAIHEALSRYASNPGDEDAARDIFRHYQRFILAAVLQSGGTLQTYDEYQVDISFRFLRALARNQITAAAAAESYLWKIARSVTRREQRKATRRRKMETEAATEFTGHVPPQPAAQTSAREELAWLRNQLPREDWTLLSRHLLDGATLAELAVELNISPSAARQRMKRLRHRIAELREGKPKI